MASNKKIAEMIAAIKTIYPYYSKDNNIEVLAKTWSVLLKNYPDDAVEAAFYKCLQICKTPPTPADVIEQLEKMIEAMGQTDEELWSVLTKALYATENQMSRFNYTYIEPNQTLTQGQIARNKVTEIWESLPDRLKEYVGSKGELMRLAKHCTDEELKFERNRFFKVLPTIKKRQEYNNMALRLEQNNKNLIGNGETQ